MILSVIAKSTIGNGSINTFCDIVLLPQQLDVVRLIVYVVSF